MDNTNSPPNVPPSFLAKKVLKLNSILESLNLIPSTPYSRIVCKKEKDSDAMLIELIKNNDDLSEDEFDEKDDAIGEEELEVEYFDRFPTRNKLAYHKYLMSAQIPSMIVSNRIIQGGNPLNLKIPCNTRNGSDRHENSSQEAWNDQDQQVRGQNYGRSYGSSSQSGYLDYNSCPPCNLCGKFHPGKACHRATGACFECGEVGHLAKDCKKGSMSSGGKRFGSVWMHPSRKFKQKTTIFWEFEEKSKTWVQVKLPYDLVSCINDNCTKKKVKSDEKKIWNLGARKRLSVTKMSDDSIWVTGISGSIYERFWNGIQWVIAPHELPLQAGYAVSVFLVNHTVLALSEAGILYQLYLVRVLYSAAAKAAAMAEEEESDSSHITALTSPIPALESEEECNRFKCGNR
ncbi:hypothetical protein Tco_0424701 [Tanacetum coccineum]